MTRRPKYQCDCGNRIPLSTSGKPIYTDGGDPICRQCFKMDKRRKHKKQISEGHRFDRSISKSAVSVTIWQSWGVAAV